MSTYWPLWAQLPGLKIWRNPEAISQYWIESDDPFDVVDSVGYLIERQVYSTYAYGHFWIVPPNPKPLYANYTPRDPDAIKKPVALARRRERSN